MTEATTSLGETIDTDDADLRRSTARTLGDHVLASLDRPELGKQLSGHSVLMLEALAAAGSPGAMRALGQLVDLVGFYPAPPPAPPTPAAARSLWARITRPIAAWWDTTTYVYGVAPVLCWLGGVPAASAGAAILWWTR